MKLNALEEMQGDLIKLLGESRELIKKQGMSFEDAKRMAFYMTEMRVLLNALWEAHSKMNRRSPEAVAYRLKEEVLELEGIVKEVRNSLEQSRKSGHKLS